MSSKPKFCWSKELTLNLIQLYQAQPILYLVKHNDYKNKTKRLAALNIIKDNLLASSVFAANQCLSIDDIKSKIHNLRTQFFKEEGKLNCGRISGSSSEIQPRLWCYKNLLFLKETESVRCGTSNTDELCFQSTSNYFTDEMLNDPLEDIKNIDTDILSPASEQSIASTPSRKRKQCNQLDIANLIATATKTLQECSSNDRQQDDLFTFGRTVEAELRAIKNKRILLQTKKYIFSLLQDARQEDIECNEGTNS